MKMINLTLDSIIQKGLNKVLLSDNNLAKVEFLEGPIGQEIHVTFKTAILRQEDFIAINPEPHITPEPHIHPEPHINPDPHTKGSC